MANLRVRAQVREDDARRFVSPRVEVMSVRIPPPLAPVRRFTDETYKGLLKSSVGDRVHATLCPTCRAPAGRTRIFERPGTLVMLP